MKAFGGDGITKDGHFNLDSEANKAALKKFDANFYNPDSQGGAQYKYVFTKGDDGFQNGTTFMTIAARPLIVKFADALEAQHRDMDFLPMPYEYNSAGNSGYGIISVHADDEVICDDGSTIKVKDAAWDFIKFIITEEGQEIGSKLGSLVPVLKSLADTGSWKQYQADKNLHHEYFTSCDTIPLDQYNAFAPSKRLMLRQIVANDVFQVYTNPGKQSDRDEALVKARQLFEKEI